MIRQAKPGEAGPCARLIRISGPELFSWIYCEDERGILDFLEDAYNTPGTTFSRESVVVDEEAGSVRGMIIAQPVPSLTRYIFKELKIISRRRGGFPSSFPRIMKMLFRNFLVVAYPRLGKDELFIANLAVFEEFRGQGVSTRLLKQAESRAAELGLSKLSLYVETDNPHARAVYEHFGFTVTARADFPKRYNRHGIYGFYKMVKRLPASRGPG